MNGCPKRDEGHEPLHSDTDDWTLFRVSMNDDKDHGPSGRIHVCRHCLLLYWVSDSEVAPGG